MGQLQSAKNRTSMLSIQRACGSAGREGRLQDHRTTDLAMFMKPSQLLLDASHFQQTFLNITHKMKHAQMPRSVEGSPCLCPEETRLVDNDSRDPHPWSMHDRNR